MGSACLPSARVSPGNAWRAAPLTPLVRTSNAGGSQGAGPARAGIHIYIIIAGYQFLLSMMRVLDGSNLYICWYKCAVSHTCFLSAAFFSTFVGLAPCFPFVGSASREPDEKKEESLRWPSPLEYGKGVYISLLSTLRVSAIDSQLCTRAQHIARYERGTSRETKILYTHTGNGP